MHRRQFLKTGSMAGVGLAAIQPSLGWAQEEAAKASLDAIARSRGLRFGTALSAEHLDKSGLPELIGRECSVIVAENEFKWKHLEPRQGKYRVEQARRLADFASEKDMLLRGHTFVWSQDNRIPQWQLDMESELRPGGGEKLIEQMWAHAEFLTKTFPTVASWDALNEAVQLQDGKLRNSLLTRVLGEQVVDVSFAIMRAKAPHAQMVYNDYMSWDRKSDHRDGVLRMLEGALRRGVKIDALGIQSHIGGSLGKNHDELAWRKFLEEIQGMGLDVLITELDCSDRFVDATDPQKRDMEVASFVKGYLDLTLSFTNVKQVVTWSLSDYDSYLTRPSYPEERRRKDGLPMRGHPYDENLQAKPMRTAIAAALAAAPEREV